MAFLLLIEADDSSRSALKAKLQAAGHVVHEAATLEDARVELKNLIERGAILEEDDSLTGRSLPFPAVRTPPAERASVGEEEPIIPLDEIEFLMVQRALRAARGNQSQAARLLQISRDQLRYRVKRYRELGRLSADAVKDPLVL